MTAYMTKEGVYTIMHRYHSKDSDKSLTKLLHETKLDNGRLAGTSHLRLRLRLTVFKSGTHSLKRTESGSFKDGDLAGLLHDAIERRAGAFKARGIPEALRFVEKMIIERSRKWGVCTVCVASSPRV